MLPVVRRWTPALALVALAGLFAMHGIGDHTAAHVALPGGSAHHGSMSATAMAADVLPDAAESAGPAGPADDGGAMALCFAVLVGGALTLAWLALAGRGGRPSRRTAWPPRRQPRSRDPDPPRPLLLGVCRC